MASRWLAVDKTLFATTVALVALGLLMVYSASFPLSQQIHGTATHFLFRQSVAAILGLGVMVVALRIDYRTWQARPIVLMAVCGSLALLVLALFVGTGGDTRRWLAFGALRVQPSEIAKVAVVLFLASYLARKDEILNEWKTGLLPALAVVGTFAVLILQAPDLGTAAALVGTAGVMLWVAGLAWHYVAGFGTLAALGAAFEIIQNPYQLRRIFAYLNPWDDPLDIGFQTVQSLIAVGAGGLTGTGLAEGRQKLSFLPQPHNDFIFAVIGEELGLIGTTVVVAGFTVILWRGVRAAMRAPDRFGFYLGIGLTAGLVMQALVNMSVVVNLVPTTGIPLPFISYGGSSLVMTCAAVGVLLNLSQHA